RRAAVENLSCPARNNRVMPRHEGRNPRLSRRAKRGETKMRTWFPTVLTLLTVTATAPAQGWADKMFRDELTHDFRTTARGTQLKLSFKITNIYAVRREIPSIKSGCGCVTETPAKRVLQPNESTTIDVSMDGRRFAGAKTVNVRVTVGPDYVSTAE